uniref:EamA domain-containing protein n=1 Tax=Aplanochytrium stocchinoi TaxID=215587 RepID=A0A7S3LNM1_9STRA|mmetsp:Transcript_9647/g.12024  ORF Transcript_9647/g.12024 Transcript_9647/m.12024 type:complete len:303 (+) Transcript_9647:2-910(+)
MDLHYLGAIGASFSILAGVLWYYSLPRTVLSANNSVYQTSPIFVYLLAVIFLGEKLTIRKLFGLCLCFGGVLLVSLFTQDQTNPDGTTQESTVGGYVLVLSSAFFMAVFEVFNEWVTHRRKTIVQDAEEPYDEHDDYHDEHHEHEEEKTSTEKVLDSILFVGFMGFYNFILLWPGIWLVSATGIEDKFELPPKHIAERMGFAACLEVGYVGFVISGIAVSSSTFMAVGQMLIIPTGYLVEILFKNESFAEHTWENYVGVLLIFLGFLCMQNLEAFEEKKRNYDIINRTEEGNAGEDRLMAIS